jgi:hypothetical protein
VHETHGTEKVSLANMGENCGIKQKKKKTKFDMSKPSVIILGGVGFIGRLLRLVRCGVG